MAADYVFVVALLFVVSCSAYFEPRIEQRVAMQWGLDGRPAWYAPKRLALWGAALFMIGVRILIWLASTYVPQKVHGAEVGIAGFSVIVAVSHLFVLLKARKPT